MDNVLPYILIFAAITMAVVFGFRSWMLAQRERRTRRLRRSGSHRHSRSFSRHSSRHFRRRSSRRFYRDGRGSDYPQNPPSYRPPGGNVNPPTPPDSSSNPQG